MNLLKSIFISSFSMVAIVITGYGGWMLYQGADLAAWGGVLLTVAPFMLLIGRLMILKNMARANPRSPLLTVLAIIGVILAVWSDNAAGGGASILAVIGLTGIMIYVYWYSILDRRGGSGIKVGDLLPDFTVMDVNNAAVTAKQLIERPTILIFYRGNWCPLCVAQIKEMVALYGEIKSLGVRVAFISPQPHNNTILLAKKFDVEFDFLTDSDNQAAHILGIENPNGLPMGMQMLGYDSETVLPTVIITGGDGKVIWCHETDNYRVRPEPDVYLEVLRSSGITAGVTT